MNTLVEKALQEMKDQGFKYTSKRENLLTFLIKRNRYVSAREVQEHMREKFPNISYDTIYRNLHDFAEVGLLEETDFHGEMKFRFHCCHLKGGHHHHFICTVCGETKEIQMCLMNFFQEQLNSYQIDGHRFEIYGRCEKCQSEN